MVARAPRKRMYRTMQGRMVDIEKLRAANESVQAVGNMNVNARGDVLGLGGVVTTPKADVMRKYYEQPKGMVDDTPSKGKPMPATDYWFRVNLEDGREFKSHFSLVRKW